MGVPFISTDPMSVEEFHTFTDPRPDEEKWELIDGEPVLNAAPSPRHKWIVRNLVLTLGTRERAIGAAWAVLPGLGVRICDVDRPDPDVLVIPAHDRPLDPRQRDTSDVIVAFEIRSPSTKGPDLGWKRTAYASLPSLTHYIVIAQDAVEVVVFARNDDFAERRLRSIDDAIEPRPLGIALPVAEIYRDTGLDRVG